MGIKDSSVFGRGTPYCTLAMGNQTFSSPPVPAGGTHPFFNTKFQFQVDSGMEELYVTVFGKNSLTDDSLLGSCRIVFPDVFRTTRELPVQPYALTRPSGNPGGEIRLSLTFTALPRPQPNLQPRPRAPHGPHPRPEYRPDPPPWDHPPQIRPAGPVRPRPPPPPPAASYFEPEPGSPYGFVHGSDTRSPRSDYGPQPFDQPRLQYQQHLFPAPPPLNEEAVSTSESSESESEDNSRDRKSVV